MNESKLFSKSNMWWWLLVVPIAVSWPIYFLVFKPLVISVVSGNLVGIVPDIIHWLYPRLSIEIHRFPPSFFVDKGFQLFARLNLVMIVGVFYLFSREKNRLNMAINNWSNPVVSKSKSVWAVRGLAILVAWFTIYNIPDLFQRTRLHAFYSPVPIFKLLHIPCFNTWFVGIVVGVCLLASLLLTIRPHFVGASIVMVLSFIAWQGFLFSFGKIDHTFATLTYCCFGLPFLVKLISKTRTSGSLVMEGWPIQLMRAGICWCYFMAGLEKLLIAGPGWASSDTFLSYLYLHKTDLGIWVGQYPFAYHLLPVFALLIQLTFPVVLFWPKLCRLYIPLGISFHWGTYLLLGAGGWLSPWICVYFLLPNYFESGKNVPRNR